MNRIDDQLTFIGHLDINCIFYFFFIFSLNLSIYRVLLRVRMLYYIKHEIIGDLVQQILDAMPIKYVHVHLSHYLFLISLAKFNSFTITANYRLIHRQQMTKHQRHGGSRNVATRVCWLERLNLVVKTIQVCVPIQHCALSHISEQTIQSTHHCEYIIIIIWQKSF